jgi:hypothetical protein
MSTTTTDIRATPNAFNRKASSPETLAQALGPLMTLVIGNQWVGDTGFNLMVVPNPMSQFIVMVSPIFETHIFDEVPAPVPNRTMSNGTEKIGAVKYSQIVAEGVTKNILHEETGMWLNQTLGSGDNDPDFGLGMVNGNLPSGASATELVTGNPIVRSGTIPHGTIQATGVSSTPLQPPTPPAPPNPPVSGNVQSYMTISNFQNDGMGNLKFLPYFKDNSDPSELQADYMTQLDASLQRLNNPALTAQQFIDPIGFLNSQANNLIKVVSMNVTTETSKGAVLNIPFETAVVAPQNFICTFLIETVANTSPDPTIGSSQDENPNFFQLQYLQSIPLLFPMGYKTSKGEVKDVIFPHFNLNTLIAI